MLHKLIVRDDALADEREAYEYYEDAQEGLGERFFLDLEATYASILRNPFAFGYASGETTVRKAGLTRFRYLVLYEIIDDEIVVFRIFHTSQEPLF